MCYTKKDRELKKEARRREQEEENKPLTEKVKEVVGVK